MTALPELIDELKLLRKGRGVFVSRIDERVGAELRDVCEVTEHDGPAQVRRKVADKLTALAEELPSDLRTAVLVAFGLYPQARLPLYKDRVAWAAEQISRDARTARRRIDDGIQQLAQLAAVPAEQAPARPSSGWRTTYLSTSLVLDGAEPILLEERRVVSGQDDLAELDLSMTAARGSTTSGSPNVTSTVLYGGTITGSNKVSDSRTAMAFALPRSLARGEVHEFALLHRIGDVSRMRPHLACVLTQPCDRFELRIKFGAAQRPEQVWVFSQIFQRDVDDETPVGEPATPDASGQIRFTFHDLAPGMAYGARWLPRTRQIQAG